MKRFHSPELTVFEIVFCTLALGIILLLFFMGPVGVAENDRNKKRSNTTGNGEGNLSSSNSKNGSMGTSVDDSGRVRASTTPNAGSLTGGASQKSNYSVTGIDGISDLRESDSPGRYRSRTRRASEFIRRRFESWSHLGSSPRATSSAASATTGTNSEYGDEDGDSPSNGSKRVGPSSQEFKEEENVDERLSLFLSGTRDDMEYVSQRNVRVKKGRMFTLGGRKPLEKPPKVKLRQFNLAGYRLSYVDSYGMRKDFDIRDCNITTKTVMGTRGAVEGQTLYAILLNCDAYDRSLLLGASTEAYRDEWVIALQDQQKLLAQIEEELSGEEDNYHYKGMPSPAEQSLLLAPLHPRIKEVLTDADQAVRRRLYSDNEEVGVISGPGGRRRNTIATRPNDVHIQNPLHPGLNDQTPDTPGSGRESEGSSIRPFSTFSSFEGDEDNKASKGAAQDSDGIHQDNVWESRPSTAGDGDELEEEDEEEDEEGNEEEEDTGH